MACFELMTGEKLTLDAAPEASIADCKQQLSARILIPASQILLSFHGSLLADTDDLASLKFASDNSILVLSPCQLSEEIGEPPVPVPRPYLPHGGTFPGVSPEASHQASSMMALALRQNIRMLENFIRSIEVGPTRIGPWIRAYPEFFLGMACVDFTEFDLDPFRNRQYEPLPGPALPPLVSSALSEEFPFFIPERHNIGGLKGADAYSYVVMCWWAFNTSNNAKILVQRPGALEDLLRDLEIVQESGPNFVRLLRRHPEYILREWGLDPSKFDLDAIRERRAKPVGGVFFAMGQRMPAFSF
jgi:hypothetical protein